jgi:hypothetical protein
MTGWMLAAACYSYVPASSAPLPPGSVVRATLNSQGTSAVTSRLGPNVVAVDGRLLSMTADGALVMTATAMQLGRGTNQDLLAEDTITFPRVLLSGVEVRTLNRRKTTMAAVAVAGSIATVGIIAMRGARADSPGNEPSPGPLTTRTPAWMRSR